MCVFYCDVSVLSSFFAVVPQVNSFSKLIQQKHTIGKCVLCLFLFHLIALILLRVDFRLFARGCCFLGCLSEEERRRRRRGRLVRLVRLTGATLFDSTKVGYRYLLSLVGRTKSTSTAICCVDSVSCVLYTLTNVVFGFGITLLKYL